MCRFRQKVGPSSHASASFFPNCSLGGASCFWSFPWSCSAWVRLLVVHRQCRLRFTFCHHFAASCWEDTAYCPQMSGLNLNSEVMCVGPLSVLPLNNCKLLIVDHKTKKRRGCATYQNKLSSHSYALELDYIIIIYISIWDIPVVFLTL